MSMFKKQDNVQVITPKKPKGKEKEQLKISGLQQFAILDAVIKQATAMQNTLKGSITEVGFEHFVQIAGKGGARPSSFEGIDGAATASVEVRKRSEASVLTDEETQTLREAGLEPSEKVIQPFFFHINPAYQNDEALLHKVEKAIEKIVPEDFIQQQPEVKKHVVSEPMLDDAFKEGMTEAVLRILTTMAVKPKLTEAYNMENLLNDAMEIMKPSKDGNLLKDALTPPAKKEKVAAPPRAKRAAGHR